MYDSIRVFYKPRENMKFSPIIIIRFEGVIGDYARKFLWDEKSEELLFRPNAFLGLSRLKQKFQVIMTCCLNPAQLEEILQLFRTQNATPDAIYLKNEAKPFSYRQILHDFDLNSEKIQQEKLLVFLSKFTQCFYRLLQV